MEVEVEVEGAMVRFRYASLARHVVTFTLTFTFFETQMTTEISTVVDVEVRRNYALNEKCAKGSLLTVFLSILDHQGGGRGGRVRHHR